MKENELLSQTAMDKPVKILIFFYFTFGDCRGLILEIATLVFKLILNFICKINMIIMIIISISFCFSYLKTNGYLVKFFIQLTVIQKSFE